MVNAKRKADLSRTRSLIESDARLTTEDLQLGASAPKENPRSSAMQTYLHQANLSLSPIVIFTASLVLGLGASVIFAKMLHAYFVPVTFVLGALLPWIWVEGRARNRAAEFSSDYPTILLATSSSIKVGMTPYLALERSIKLLPQNSLVRKEVEQLIGDLRRGVPKDKALQNFAVSIRLPELSLFRTAFYLVLENGGKFAPTLERLARVSKDRDILISGARVSTATMRMTANVLLVAAPVVISIIAARTENYWELLIEHPVANAVASTGVIIIILCYAMMRRLSNFKP